MTKVGAAPVADGFHATTGGATWLSSLRVRLALVVAATVALTVGAAAWMATTAARHLLAQDVIQLLVRTGERAADALEVMPEPLSRATVAPVLAAVHAGTPMAQQVSALVVTGERVDVVAAAGAPPQPPGLALARRAAERQDTEVSDDEQIIRVAVPVNRDDVQGAVVLVRGDVESLVALQQRAFRSVAVFAILAAVGLVLLVDMAARAIVFTPFQAMRDTMSRAAAGDYAARVPVARDDELGQVGRGLNDMLDEIERLYRATESKMREALSEVGTRNQELTESYRRALLLRERLASAEHLASIGQTAANVAHEVGTPLNLITGYVQLMKEEVAAGSPLAGRLAIIEAQAAKVTASVRALLDRSRRTGPRSAITAATLFAHVADAVRPTLDAAQVRLETSVGTAGAAHLLVDVTGLELAFRNLIVNAVEAMPGGGQITLSVTSPGADMLRVAIRDAGHGIPAELLPQIFEPFVSTKPDGATSGLGLAIARDAIVSHGGTIVVDSRPGEGTTFTVDLPVITDVADVEPR